MTLAEIIQRVQSLYSSGLQSDDARLTSRHIYSAITTARSTLVRQRSDKNQKISQWSYQSLHCIELEKAPIHECPCIPKDANQGCMILRSIHKLPQPIVDLDNELIKYVTSLDASMKFDLSSYETEKYASGNKYTSKKPTYYLKDERIYISILRNLKVIAASGLFNDPVEAHNFSSLCGECEGCECNDILDMQYPIDGDLVKPLIDLAQKELIILMKQIPEDKSNNASDDTAVSGMIHTPQSTE